MNNNLSLSERHAQILQRIRQGGYVSVDELAKSLSVSDMTIRRDLNILQNMGLISRHHGGASPAPDPGVTEGPYIIRETEHLSKKQIIAREAIKYIQEGDVIILDSGTTTLQLAKVLDFSRLTVVSNSLPTIAELSRQRNFEVISIGGSLRWDNQCFVGPLAINSIRSINANTAFVGITALSLSRGLTTRDMSVAEVKRALIDVSETVVLLMDSSKINSHTLATVCRIEDIDILITDNEIKDVDKQAIEEKGVKVVIAH